MNFVIVGAGPTGVEIAGALAELKRHVLPHDYPELDFADMHITLVESSDHAERHERQDLTPTRARNWKPWRATCLGVRLSSHDGMVAKLNDGTDIRTSALLWTAGVKGAVIAGIPSRVWNAVTASASTRSIVWRCGWSVRDRRRGGDDGRRQCSASDAGSVAMQQGKLLAKNLNRPKGQAWQPFVQRPRHHGHHHCSKAVAELAAAFD